MYTIFLPFAEQPRESSSDLLDELEMLSLECGSDLRDYQKLIRETKLANAYARK